ncbi:MAG TPA: hypothetical protein ENK57_07585 [Polyangiaceae bacterium]|nr:hypothetical protein [Polyangiaceae bacterium]
MLLRHSPWSRRFTAPLMVAGLLTFIGAAGTAAAQDAPTQDAPTPGADEYTRRVQAGIQSAITGDRGAALAAFRDAIALDGSRPQAPYYLAATQRAAGELQDAVTGFERARDLAADSPRWRARALQAIADTLERMEGQLQQARAAWNAYVQFADANAAVSHPQMGRARAHAIDAMLEQERAFVSVRERIAARERENAEH